MIDQQVPPVPTPPHHDRRRRRWRLVGFTALGLVATLLVAAVALALALSAAAFAGSQRDEGRRHHAGEQGRRTEASAEGQRTSATPTTPDAAGAADAALAFVDAFEVGYRTGDFTAYAAAQAPSCSTCQELTAPVQEARARSTHLGDPGMDVPVVTVSGVDGDVALVHTTIDVSTLEAHRSDGSQVSVPGYRAETDLYLVWSGDRWEVAALDGDSWCLQLEALSSMT